MKNGFEKLLNPPKKEKLYEGITSQMKTLIFSKKIGMGEKLPSERELAEILKVSRVVVRESLRSLQQSGLIEIKPGSVGGSYVAYNLHKPLVEATHDLLREGKLNLHHFYEARKAIECFSIRLATKNAAPEDLKRLETINQKLIEEIADKSKLREHNTAFHVAIADISGNPLIRLVVQSLMELLHSFYPESGQSRTYIRKTYERHQAIIKALEIRKISLCEKLIAEDTEHTSKLAVTNPTRPHP